MLRILTFHRVVNPEEIPDFDPKLVSARPDVFEKQMQYLAKNYNVVSMHDVLASFESKLPLPGKSVLITFDDAYTDFIDIAWPILKKYHLPATMFVPTGFPDDHAKCFWWDKLFRALRHTRNTSLKHPRINAEDLDQADKKFALFLKLRNITKGLEHKGAMLFVDEVCQLLGYVHKPFKSVMSWNELKKLAREGLSLGAHTRNHPVMTRLSNSEIRAEIHHSLHDLAENIGSNLPIFCYPAGGYNNEVARILQDEGVQLAFTTRDGHNDLKTVDPYSLRRTNITQKSSPFIFRMRLTRWFSYLDAYRHKGDRALVGADETK